MPAGVTAKNVGGVFLRHSVEKTALDEGRTNRISPTHDLDLEL